MSTNDLQSKTLQYAVRLGDDSLILGHRLSEWSSSGPFLEEDLALSNTALDYLGRARMYYTYAAELEGGETTEDTYAYTRGEREFQNLLMLELPRGDFAFTMARQFLVDCYQIEFLQKLQKSHDLRLAAIAAKSIKESKYHLRRSRDWIIQLGDGTEESHNRTQTAFNSLWGYIPEWFDQDELELELAKQGIAVTTQSFRESWQRRVNKVLQQATLKAPTDTWEVKGGRQGYHTENLGHLLTELQFLNRSMPGLKW